PCVPLLGTCRPFVLVTLGVRLLGQIRPRQPGARIDAHEAMVRRLVPRSQLEDPLELADDGAGTGVARTRAEVGLRERRRNRTAQPGLRLVDPALRERVG